MLDKNLKCIYNKLNSVEKKIVKKIIENKLIENNDKLVVAVSGGPDSMCLINSLLNIKEYILYKYSIKYTMCIAHFNHKIRKESKQEKEYVKEYAKINNLEFCYKEENIIEMAKETKTTIEECARNQRYIFLNDILEKTNSNKIVVAHNQNDNVETILLNIIRGSGIQGLVGMTYRFKNIIRPMLDITKEEVLKYCEEKNINPCIDKTNFSEEYKRNKVRLKLIPYLKEEYNQNIEQTITRMSKIIEQEEDFMKKYTDEVLEKFIKKVYNTKSQNKIEIDYTNLFNYHEAIVKRVVRELINRLIGNVDGIEQIHVFDIIKLLKKNTKGKKYIIGNKFTIEITSKNNAVIYTN